MKAVILSSILSAAFAISASADGNFEQPVLVRSASPVFPYTLRRQGVSGVVQVNCLIDQQGNVQDVKIEKTSNEGFVQPAMTALKKWKFKPAQRDGSPVPVRISIPIRFTIED